MKKTLLTLLSSAAFATSAFAQFNTSGIATFTGGVINLAPITAGAPCGGLWAGAAWDGTTTINFYQNFRIEFDAEFTQTGAVNNGADGIVVVFGSNINTSTGGSVGPGGGSLGYYSGGPAFNNSIGVEFDIFDNQGSIGDASPLGAVNHVMIARDANPALVLAPMAQIDPSNPLVENVGPRHYVLEWDCASRTLNVYFEPATNPAPRASATFNPATVFTAPSSVRWGFTGARGTQCSDHFVTNVQLSSTPSDCAQPERCATPEVTYKRIKDCEYEFTVYPNFGANVILGSYLWDFDNDGTIDATTTNPVISHVFPGPGSYMVKVIVMGYNTVTKECCTEEVTFQIFVECQGKGMMKESTSVENAYGSNSSLLIAPNPTNTGEFNVQLEGQSIRKVKVYNMTGSWVHEGHYNSGSSQKIDLSKLSNGMYTVEVLDDNGNGYKTKVVINK